MRFIHKKAVILLVAAVTVFLLAGSAARGKIQFGVAERIINTVLAPVDFMFSKIGYSFRQASSTTGDIFAVYHNNQILRAENDELRQNILNNTEMMAENTRLRAMLDYKKGVTQFDMVTASVISRDPGTWTSVIMINRGTADGVVKDMPVVTPQGLVGNVVTAYQNSARVQLILDPRSAVGALVQRSESRVAAIVEGNGSNPVVPRMVNLARDADVIKGDKVITSGFGGIYPKGLLIGEVLDVVNEEGGLLKYAVLKPAVDFDRLEEVFVIIRSREPAPQVPVPAPAGPNPVTPQVPKGGTGQ